MNPIGIVASALSNDPRLAPRAARSLGFEGVEFDAISSALDVTELSQTGQREFRHVLSSADQQLVGLRADVGVKGFAAGADIDRTLARMRKILEAAKGLNAPLVCLDVGPLPEPVRAAKPQAQITPEQAGLIIIPAMTAPTPRMGQSLPPDPSFIASTDAALIELGALADRMSMTVALRTELSSFAALDRALKAAACPWFGVDLDPVAMLRDEWNVNQVLSSLGTLIRHVRGRDAIAGTDRRTRQAVIGQGSVTWPELLAGLESSDYRGWITIDPLELADRTGGAVAGAKYLRSLRTSAQ